MNWQCACKALFSNPETLGKHKLVCKTTENKSGWQGVDLDGIPTICDRSGMPKPKEEQDLFKTKWLKNS